MKYLITLFSLLVLSGCQTTALTNQATINSLQAQQATSEDARLHLELAKQYIAAADESRSTDYLEKAIIELEAFSLKVPNHLGAVLTRYQLHFALSKQGITSRDEGLFNTFNHLPSNVKEQVEPPSLASALYHLQSQGFSNTKTLRGLLQKSIKEQPKSSKSHFILANLYAQDERYTLAIPLMDKATKLDPDNGHLRKEYGELLLDHEDSSCFYDVDSPFKKSLDEFRVASKLIPNDPDVHYYLSLIYTRLGRHFLAINEVKKLNELENSDDNKLEIADAYFYAGKTIEAGEIYSSLLSSSQTSPYRMEHAAQYYLATQDWKRSSELWKEYFATTTGSSFYNWLSYSYSEEQIKGRETALKDFGESTAQLELNNRENRLRAFRLGEVSKTDLYGSAKSKCDYTEANFIIGMNELLQGNKTDANKYFTEVLTYNAYAFVEYAVAQEYIKER